MSKNDSIKIGKQGLNPTIPICHYCNKAKDLIMLTGLAGEKEAKKMGRSDGQMPMSVYIKEDIEPCDECKKKGIFLIESKDGKFTGGYAIIDKEKINKDCPEREKILEYGFCVIDRTGEEE